MGDFSDCQIVEVSGDNFPPAVYPGPFRSLPTKNSRLVHRHCAFALATSFVLVDSNGLEPWGTCPPLSPRLRYYMHLLRLLILFRVLLFSTRMI